MPKVSVVIPCYNQGKYLDEAVGSILAQSYDDYEIIVVDDGSTEQATQDLLRGYERPKTRVFRIKNQGVSAARNFGIEQAHGACVLCLDADDMIGPTYFEQAVPVLDAQPRVGIVYCEARYFGAFEGRVPLPPFETVEMLSHNIIFNAAMFRKEDWTACGGYNMNMVYGWEDWDLWLSILEFGRTVHRIPEILFFYRIKESDVTSRNRLNEEQRFFMRLHAIFNHRQLYRNTVELRMGFKFAQLYYDTGSGIHEGQVVTRVVLGDELQLVFPLPTSQRIKSFRFDPLTDLVVVRINGIQVVDGEGGAHGVAVRGSNALFVDNDVYSFDSGDSWMEWSMEEFPQSFCEVRVSLEYVAMGSDAAPLLLAASRSRSDERVEKALAARQEVCSRELAARDASMHRLENELQSVRSTLTWRLRIFLRGLLGKEDDRDGSDG